MTSRLPPPCGQVVGIHERTWRIQETTLRIPDRLLLPEAESAVTPLAPQRPLEPRWFAEPRHELCKGPRFALVGDVAPDRTERPVAPKLRRRRGDPVPLHEQLGHPMRPLRHQPLNRLL